MVSQKKYIVPSRSSAAKSKGWQFWELFRSPSVQGNLYILCVFFILVYRKVLSYLLNVELKINSVECTIPVFISFLENSKEKNVAVGGHMSEALEYTVT